MTGTPGIAVQVMSSVGLRRGGLTRATYARIRMLRDAGWKVLVLSIGGNESKKLHELVVKEAGIEGVEILNFYLCLNNGVKTEIANIDRSKYTSVTDGSSIRYFHGDKFRFIETHPNEAGVWTRTVHNAESPWVPLYVDHYEGDRLLKRVYLSNEFKPKYVSYFGEDGCASICHWVNDKGRNYRVVDLSSGSVLDAISPIQKEWIYQVCEDVGADTVLFDEPAVNNLISRGGWRNIVSIHTTHNFEINGVWKPKVWVDSYINRLSLIDTLVFITEKQMADFTEEYPSTKSLSRSIPHFAPQAIERLDGCDQNVKISIVSRLSPEKRIGLVVEAMKVVAFHVPTVKLDIYGDGPLRAEIQSKIDQDGLGDYVSLCGFTGDPSAVFAASKLSVMASKFEGFGLTLLESMAAGCPVVGFGVNYGPVEVIDDGVNGLLVDDGDLSGLAHAIIKVLKDRELQSKLSAGAHSTARTYSFDRWRDGWLELLWRNKEFHGPEIL